MKVSVVSQYEDNLNRISRVLSEIEGVEISMFKSSRLPVLHHNTTGRLINNSDLVVFDFDFDDKRIDYSIGLVVASYVPIIAVDTSSGSSITVANNVESYKDDCLSVVSSVSDLTDIVRRLSSVLGEHLGVTQDLATVIAEVQSLAREMN